MIFDLLFAISTISKIVSDINFYLNRIVTMSSIVGLKVT
jgi:hypothetical protein